MPARLHALLRLALLAPLVMGGCGGGKPSWSMSFALGPAAAGKPLTVSAWKGTVRLRNGADGALEVKLMGEAPLPPEQVVVFVSDERGPSLRIAEGAKDAKLDLEIAAPAGVPLVCMCADADVAVEGSWSAVEVKTTGGSIDARVSDVAGGLLESQRGSVALAPTGKGPTGEFTAKSFGGNVSISLRSSWNGQIHFLTQTGELDVPPHEGLRTIWDATKKGVVAHLGPAHERGAPLAVVWATSAKGKVSFRVVE